MNLETWPLHFFTKPTPLSALVFTSLIGYLYTEKNTEDKLEQALAQAKNGSILNQNITFSW